MPAEHQNAGVHDRGFVLIVTHVAVVLSVPRPLHTSILFVVVPPQVTIRYARDPR